MFLTKVTKYVFTNASKAAIILEHTIKEIRRFINTMFPEINQIQKLLKVITFHAWRLHP